LINREPKERIHGIGVYEFSFYPGVPANTIVNSVNYALVNLVSISRRD
jgi:hypothetical protein